MISFYSMNKFFGFFKSISIFLALPILSGILVGTSYIPFYGWALFFGYIPLWFKTLQIIDKNKNITQVFWAAWVTQFVLTLIGFNWIYYVSVEFGLLHPALALGALVAFAGLMHLYIPIAITFSAFLIRRFNISNTVVRFLILALNMGLIERIWPSIFEWNLAYTLLWIKWPLYQWADTVGFWGLSTWLLVAQAFIANALTFIKTDRKLTFKLLGLVVAILASLTFVGFVKGQNWSKTDQVAKIGVAQGNIGNAEKIQSEKHNQYHSYIIGIYSKLTSEMLKNEPTDLVIWPETAMPLALDKAFHSSKDQNAILNAVRNWNIPVVTGAYSVNRSEKNYLGETVIRNSVFYLSPKFEFAAPPYNKTNLLAFGEYLPLGELFPVLYKYLTFVGVYAKGSGPVVAKIQLKEKVLNLGPQICYDSLYPGFSRELALNGAQVLFNVTNDAWFGWWAEPFQHQFMTLGRAIEVRRPLVRSTNTGFSSAILADGTLLANSPINEAWAHSYEIKYKSNPPLTIYTRFGHLDWIVWLLILISIVIIYRKKGKNV